MKGQSIETVEKMFKLFRAVAEKDRDLLYHKLCNFLLDDKKLLELGKHVNPTQPAANIVLGALHYLILSGSNHKLAEYYPSVTDKPLSPKDLEIHILEDFIEKNKDKIIELCKNKLVQTNEVARCAFLLPAVTYLSKLDRRPIELIELGTSAGLLLNFDKYGYKYSHLEDVIGNSELILSSETKGNYPPPLPNQTFPKLKNKLGIDINPLYCNKLEDILWLQALIWPYKVERLTRLRKALKICKSSDLTLVKDDAFSNITTYLEDFLKYSTNVTPLIYHSFAINQVEKSMRDQFYKNIQDFVNENDIKIYELRNTWKEDQTIEIELREYRKNISNSTRLAIVHHHGEWIEWLVER